MIVQLEELARKAWEMGIKISEVSLTKEQVSDLEKELFAMKSLEKMEKEDFGHSEVGFINLSTGGIKIKVT